MRGSGNAPQFTAMNGLARRAPLPWMARAINSLPTPDSPSINTGIVEAAAFSALCSTVRIGAERVMTSEKLSVPSRLRLARASSPASALVASALRSETCRRSAPTGLTTKSAAPARMAETTLSMPPWAVCTITGAARRGGVAAFGNDRIVAESAHHVVQQAALYRIVVDDQNPLGHDALHKTVPNWRTFA